MQRVVGVQEGAQTSAGIVGLGPTFGGQLDAVVGDRLVDGSVFLGMLRTMVERRTNELVWQVGTHCSPRSAHGGSE